MLWGKGNGSRKFTTINFVDYDNEIRTGSSDDIPEITESKKTFEIIELNGDCIDIGLPHGMTKLLVPKEYELAKDAIEEHRGLGRGGMMITGQPGIGASPASKLYLLAPLKGLP